MHIERLNNSFYDASADYNELKETANNEGHDLIMSVLNDTFPERNLYSFSTGWELSDEYILKARGTNGDVIVGWSHRIGV